MALIELQLQHGTGDSDTIYTANHDKCKKNFHPSFEHKTLRY